ncbi:hypothetical protein AB5N19_10443 [Seiridium cardinale]
MSDLDRVHKELSETRAMIDSLIITYSSKVWRLTFYWHTDIRDSPGSNGSVEKISTQLESIGVKTNDIANAIDALTTAIDVRDRCIEDSLDTIKSTLLGAKDSAKHS